MHAQPGDRIVIKGHHVGEPEKDCLVLAVLGPDGEPPYRIRWGDTGHEGLFFPGSDALVVPYDEETTTP
jgi:hypothetical protein